MAFVIKRVYEEPEPADGYRILVDRLWPRGVSHERAHLDTWDKDIAPSPELRTWYGHDPAKFTQFAERYRAELDAHPDAVAALTHLGATHPRVTLLFAAHDPQTSHAAVLRDYLAERS